MRFLARRRAGVSSIVGSIFFVLIMIVAVASLVTMFNSFTAYNQQVNSASNSNLQAADTQLSVKSGQFGAFPPSTTSNFNVATGCLTTSTQTTNTAHLFYAANMWWDFYTCNSAFQYSTSFDGVTWSAATSIPAVIASGYTVGPYWNIDIVGTTIYLAIAKVAAADFQLGIGTIIMGGTNSAPAGTISWTSAPAQVATTGNVASVAGPIQVEVDGSGNIWVATVQGATAIGVYERQACASGTSAANGWEPNACSSATAPTNYAPTASPNLGALSANANMIMMAAPSTLSSTGIVLIYETGSATVPSTGSLGVITEGTLATTTWNTISVVPLGFDYSLTSSSTAWVSNTIYFAGQAGTAVGDNTCTGGQVCTLRFWTAAFTSISAGTVSSDASGTPNTSGIYDPIESSSQLWQAALTSAGTTLALFDAYPTGTSVNYYTSGTLGAIWSSAITLESAETAVNGLAPASGVFAATWANSAPNVRFAALSTFTLSNSSPFGVHIVDAYVYNPASNALVAHWYFNTTGTGAEDFDWWVGQGSTMSIPLRFIWTANTAYLITFSTDNGVTAQTTLTTLPGGTVSCSSGQFFYEISPNDLCATAPGTTNPLMVSGAGASTCTDSTMTTALMMGLGMSYTTSSITSGNVFFSFAFQVTSPATNAVTSTWQLYYGTGSSPTCNMAATGTALGQAYTVRSQAAIAKSLAQSVTVTLTGLSPSTTYWFDLQASDSSGANWIYSNPDMSLVEAQTTNSPKFTASTNTNSCPDTTNGAPKMMGFGTTFTTGGAGFTGNVIGKLTFNVLTPGTANINSAYKLSYGTGAAPTCTPGTAGTLIGQTYTVASQTGTAGGSAQKDNFVLTGLAASTTYWVDIQATDNSGAQWTYSNPVLAVMEMPTATNSLPNVAESTNANTCTVATATTLKEAGFGVGYTIPSSAEGNLRLTLTFQVTIPATNPANTQWELVWGDGASPACNSPGFGITPGNTYTITSQSGTNVGGLSQSESFVIPDIQKVAGTTIWVDIIVYDSTGTNWIFSNPTLTGVMFLN